MIIEVLLLVLIASAIFILWGLKAKNPMLFSFGCLLIMTSGIMLTSTGLETSKVETFQTLKTGDTYDTSIQYVTVTPQTDTLFWGLSWAMMIIPIILIPASLQIMKQKI